MRQGPIAFPQQDADSRPDISNREVDLGISVEVVGDDLPKGASRVLDTGAKGSVTVAEQNRHRPVCGDVGGEAHHQIRHSILVQVRRQQPKRSKAARIVNGRLERPVSISEKDRYRPSTGGHREVELLVQVEVPYLDRHGVPARGQIDWCLERSVSVSQ